MKTNERLKAANLRVTKARIRILDILEARDMPMAHTEILNLAQDIDRVTLYRVLDSLVAASLVHKVQGTDGTWRFCAHEDDGQTCPGGHAHFLCEKCGQMFCLTDQKIPHFELPNAFTVSHKQVLILGLCDACHHT